jgi:hypothetical protein
VERIAFIVDATGERIDCLLNPETFEVKRSAGVQARRSTGGHLVGVGLADDPLLFTGGGRTEIVLDLLFDVEVIDAPTAPRDVRTITGQLWRLAENAAPDAGAGRPPLVRLVWGKTWNICGVIVAVAERFDAFDATGVPRRSWLRLKLVRTAEPATAYRSFDDELTAASRTPPMSASAAAVPATGDGGSEPGYSGVRFDLLAAQATGSPLRWRALAAHNGIDNPFDVPAGSVLAIPPDVDA